MIRSCSSPSGHRFALGISHDLQLCRSFNSTYLVSVFHVTNSLLLQA
jgi:hypothetical protein